MSIASEEYSRWHIGAFYVGTETISYIATISNGSRKISFFTSLGTSYVPILMNALERQGANVVFLLNAQKVKDKKKWQQHSSVPSYFAVYFLVAMIFASEEGGVVQYLKHQTFQRISVSCAKKGSKREPGDSTVTYSVPCSLLAGSRQQLCALFVDALGRL